MGTRCGSNEYPCNVCFESKMIKYVFQGCKSQFYYIKVGYEGYTFHGHVIVMMYITTPHCTVLRLSSKWRIRERLFDFYRGVGVEDVFGPGFLHSLYAILFISI